MPLNLTLDERALRKYLDRSIKSWPDAASDALHKVGREVFDQSQREVPVGKTSHLKGTAFMIVSKWAVLIVYPAEYSRYVHFRKKVRHPTGKRLFLSRPLSKGKRLLPSIIQQFVQGAMDQTPSS